MIGIYFSGTGNTKYCVERFLKSRGESGGMFSVEEEEAAGRLSEERDILLAYPIYYSSLPGIMEDFIRENKDRWKDKNVFVLSTMALFSGDGSGLGARLVKKYGAVVAGGLHVVMPDCISDVKLLKYPEEKNRRIVRTAGRKIDTAAAKCRAGSPPRDGLGPLSYAAGLLGQRLWFSRAALRYRDKLKIDPEKCIGCGICAARCPVQNLKMADGRAAARGRCMLCYRCVNRCPEQAVTLLGKRVVARYDPGKYMEIGK